MSPVVRLRIVPSTVLRGMVSTRVLAVNGIPSPHADNLRAALTEAGFRPDDIVVVKLAGAEDTAVQ